MNLNSKTYWPDILSTRPPKPWFSHILLPYVDMIKLFIYFWVTLIGCLLTNKLPNIVTMTLYVAEMHAQKFRVGKSSTLYLNRDAKPATVFPGHCFPPSLFLNPNSLSLSVCLSPKIQFDFWAPFTVPHTFSTFSFLYFLEKNFSLLPKPLLPPPLLSLSLSLTTALIWIEILS